MMFEIFQSLFLKDTALSVESDGSAPHSEVVGLNSLIERFGGASFEHGIYRVVRASEVHEWNTRAAIPFPEFGGSITCFGFDWLGRVFAVDRRRCERGQPGVVMFEPGTGEALEIPCDIASFHDEELIEFRDAALASNFQDRWLASGGAAPRYGQCIGYRKPLFLGGADDLSNLELFDIDVYWHLTAQLIVKAKGLPLGTPIRVSVP